MIEDFTELQNIEEPEIIMISGPVSYTKFMIFNQDQLLKEIEIFGDEHFSDDDNCTEHGESCIYITRNGIVRGEQGKEINCVDIPTYLGCNS